MISRLLLANRGEIARRVFATCRRLGIETVAVHSDADAELPFVAEADLAVRLPGDTPTQTYLNADLIIDAARRAGADAIHPGYGFLSENADFARAVIAAGLTWVGPSPESIARMGSKVEAKKLMATIGVPVLDDLGPDSATEQDLPLLVKASAGGGGRGMRIVRTLADLPGAMEKARDEARSAFGDGAVFVEPYLPRSRHIEVQVVGFAGGHIAVLGDRDCSIQRRHQKVVEEAPAPGLSEQVRAAMHRAAATAASAIGYRGAGTVEFLYDAATERFYFLEMNTRLQVEHPVTEEVAGVDLVELQLTAAEGRVPQELGTGGGGHAIEARLYAEDPAADYQPHSGRLTAWEIPGVTAEFGRVVDGIRLDAGVVAGSEVSTYYDAMLAKVIAVAPTRELAARRLAGALSRARIHGLVTNRDLLVQVLRHEAFLAGEVTTSFLPEHGLPDAAEDAEAVRRAAQAATVALAERDRLARPVQRGIPVAWRNVVSQPQVTRFAGDLEVAWWGGRDGLRLQDAEVVAIAHHDDVTAVRLEVDGVRTTYQVSVVADAVDVDSVTGHVRLHLLPRFADPHAELASGSLVAPMPGSVVRVVADRGQQVRAGDPILVLEAMKMQHTVAAPADGEVTEIAVRSGQQVAAGDVLAVVVATTGQIAPTQGEPA